MMEWLKRVIGGAPTERGPDGFSFKVDDELAKQHRQLSEYLHVARNVPTALGAEGFQSKDVKDESAGARILETDRESQELIVRAALARVNHIDARHRAALARINGKDLYQSMDSKNLEEKYFSEDDAALSTYRDFHPRLVALIKTLLTRQLPWTESTILQLIEWFLFYSEQATSRYFMLLLPVADGVTAVESFFKCHRDCQSLQEPLESLIDRLSIHRDADSRRLIKRLNILTGMKPELPSLESGEAWTDSAISTIAKYPSELQVFWTDILFHCSIADSSEPTQKWLAEMKSFFASDQQVENFKANVQSWFSLVDKPRTGESASLHNVKVGEMFITCSHMDILRGLAWTCSMFPVKDLARSLTELALTCYKKIPGVGPRAVRVGNAAINSLGMMGTEDALGQLALLKVKVKVGSAQAAIDKTMNKLAGKLGVRPDDLEEMSAPAYGMTDVGSLLQPIGEFTAELTVINSRKTQLVWKRADGKALKSLPSAVTQEHAEEVKELMAAKKDIEKMLLAQAERLDGLYLQRKSWPLETWRERYLDHPLIGALARRLIWNFKTGEVTTQGVWLDGSSTALHSRVSDLDKPCATDPTLENQASSEAATSGLVDRLGNRLELAPEQTTVTLWHPLDQSPDVVLGWRFFLEEWEIMQPFKQAHREVYLLTPAEEQTRVYSNRFAAHLLHQHQFNALCAARGWKNKLRLGVDANYPPATRWLVQWGLRAEYWIEGAGEDFLESTAYRYVSTDQVRFYQTDAPQVSAHARGGGYRILVTQDPLSLADIPRLVLSEIMRDVDLFVGVASVGNDPNWLDGGTNESQRGYWHSVSFGELNASAQTRREILKRLIPKLKIAAQCRFEERFLIVEGKRHAYKIHLGSGNILIIPQDKYLCIVRAQAQVDRAGEKVFLPFERDSVLSVILSKALLLAADDKITDETILQQL